MNLNHLDIIEKLCEAGYPSYIVGGAVRDSILGDTPKDIDIATKATPEEIERLFNLHKGAVGKSFGVVLVGDYEVATFREDRYETYGAKNCQVSFASDIITDISRRDISVNGLALCPISGKIIDNFDGQGDLRKGIIRFIGDGEQRILEDPARIIRACRFLAKLEGRFAKDTLKVLKESSHLLSQVAPERLGKEVMKAMETRHPSLFFGALEVIGALDYVFPGFSVCVNHTHGNHHKETVWEHLMLVGDSITSKHPLVRLAGYLHDCGKPYSYSPIDGTFIGHENSSAFLARKWLSHLKFSNSEIDRVTGIIQTHMLGASPGNTPKAIRRFRKTLADLGVTCQDWLRLRIADRKGNINKTPFNFSDIRYRRGIFEDQDIELPFTVNSLALKGGDLIRIFNLTPGPIVGKLQKDLLSWVIEEGPEKNTPENLEGRARELLS